MGPFNTLNVVEGEIFSPNYRRSLLDFLALCTSFCAMLEFSDSSAKLRGPKTNYRRTDELERQIIRHRFLDPDAAAEVIAQRLHQTRHVISIRSVERVADKISVTSSGSRFWHRSIYAWELWKFDSVARRWAP